MRHRDLLTIREHRAEIEAQERAEREKREAPIKEAEKKFNETARRLRAVMVERITKGKDDEFKIDPATFTPIPKQITAEQFNRSEAARFCQENPDYFPCEENLRAITDYIDRNAPKIVLVSAVQLGWAYKRLNEYGLLRERPAPQEEPEPAPEPEPEKPAEPELIDGWDVMTGEPRQWTRRQLDRLSADEYRRALRLTKDKLTLPNIGPGPRPAL